MAEDFVAKHNYEVILRFEGVLEEGRASEPIEMTRVANLIVNKFQTAPFKVSLIAVKELEGA